jgi:hypothetical protein
VGKKRQRESSYKQSEKKRLGDLDSPTIPIHPIAAVPEWEVASKQELGLR